MKGNFQKKIFRSGYNAHGIGADKYNGKESKRDWKTTRTKLKNFLNTLK